MSADIVSFAMQVYGIMLLGFALWVAIDEWAGRR